MTRQNKIAAIIGARGTGKTDYLRGNTKHKLPGFFSAYVKRGIKVAVIDTFDHPSYSDIEVLPQNQFEKWKSGVKRIIIDPEEIQDFNGYLVKSKNAYNTLLVYEDAVKHTFVQVDKNLRRLMIDSKQKNIDIIFMYHSFAQAPTNLYRLINFIELFKTQDTPECRKNFMTGYYETAMRVYDEVQKNKNHFFHKLIDTGI